MKKNNINKIGYSNIEIARFEGSMIVRNYHEDWNELMRVVKKIKELKINDFAQKKQVIHALVDVDIEILHNAVSEFSKWYNENSKIDGKNND